MKTIILKFKKFKYLVSFYQDIIGNRNFLKMLISGLIISILEFTGLALIFPLMKLIIDKNFNEISLFVIGITLIFIYFLRGYTNSSLIKFQANLASKINYKLSDEIISKSLSSRYQLFLNISPIKISTTSHTNAMHASLLFQSLAAALNETLLIGIIFLSILFISPFGFLGFCLFIIILFTLILKPISRYVANIGKKTQEIDFAHNRFVFTMSNAIRDIKIMGLEKPFIKRNKEIAQKHSNLFAKYTYISSLQRMIIESLLACFVVIGILFFSYSGSSFDENGALIITLGMILVRTAPALSRLSNSYNAFKYSLPFVNSLLDTKISLLNYPQKRLKEDIALKGEYSAENLYFSYGKNQILKGCSITLKKGIIVAVIGESGAGKSTLLDLLAGLIKPQKGKFMINNIKFSPFLSEEFPSKIGYVPQSISLIDDTISFNITFDKKPNLKLLNEAINKSNLKSYIKQLQDGVDTKIGEGGQGLSGGQRQRLGIARALYRNPSILILDEITSSLDEENASKIINELSLMKNEVKMIFVSHNMNYIKADVIYKLQKGKLNLIK